MNKIFFLPEIDFSFFFLNKNYHLHYALASTGFQDAKVQPIFVLKNGKISNSTAATVTLGALARRREEKRQIHLNFTLKR